MTRQGCALLTPPSPLAYPEGHALLRKVHAERAANARPDALILLEHLPVVTLGANADLGGVTSPEALSSLGIGVHRVERGGEATCHLPGQLVAYPVVDLRRRGLGVKAFVTGLEEVMIRACGALGVRAGRIPGVVGIFREGRKLGAVGIAVKGGVTLHGLALNVRCDLAPFGLIVPCGRADLTPTTLTLAAGREIGVEEAREAFITAWEEEFGPVSR